MEMNVRSDRKLVDIWLTNTEKNDPKIRSGLQDIYSKYKKENYLVVVFTSGNQDLYSATRELLLNNKYDGAERSFYQNKN